MRKKRAPEVKNLLAALKAKMAVKGSSSEEIVGALKKQHRDVIARENPDLMHIALMKLVGATASARRPAAAQIEMFAEYALPTTVLFPMPDGSKLHRQVDLLTPAEGREYVESRTKPRGGAPSEIKELARLLDDVEPYKRSARSTIGECWNEFRASKAS